MDHVHTEMNTREERYIYTKSKTRSSGGCGNGCNNLVLPIRELRAESLSLVTTDHTSNGSEWRAAGIREEALPNTEVRKENSRTIGPTHTRTDTDTIS